MRESVPRESHAQYEPSPDRPDPIALLQSQDAVRIQELVPIRFGRMAVSPFSFYRGAAIVMANDLATTPKTGWPAQACGDAHLENFGAFGYRGRLAGVRRQRLRRDVPGSVGVGPEALGRQCGAGRSRARRKALRPACGRPRCRHRLPQAMQRLAGLGVMDRWTAVVDVPKVMTLMGSSKRQIDKATASSAPGDAASAPSRSSPLS